MKIYDQRMLFDFHFV